MQSIGETLCVRSWSLRVEPANDALQATQSSRLRHASVSRRYFCVNLGLPVAQYGLIIACWIQVAPSAYGANANFNRLHCRPEARCIVI